MSKSELVENVDYYHAAGRVVAYRPRSGLFVSTPLTQRAPFRLINS